MVAWSDSNVKPHVQAAAREIGTRFGTMNIGGYRSGADAQDHGLGLALDVMTTTAGESIAQFAQQNAARLGITYVIWNQAIWDSRNNRGWEPMADRGSPTANHKDHVHISFKPEGGDPNASVTPVSNNPGCASILTTLMKGASASA
jgi:hypothetical protein